MLWDFTGLSEEMKIKAYGLLTDLHADRYLKSLGCEWFKIIEGKRSLEVQMAYYSRSRMAVEDVKKMYKAAGLYDISDAEAQTPNTWTLESKHIKGLAIDICPVKDNKLWWSAPSEVWEKMGKLAKKNGLKWGGEWDTPDRPHFEM